MSRAPLLLTLLLSAVLAGASAGPAGAATVVPGNPLAARPFYVDPGSPAAAAVKAHPATAKLVSVLATTPQARWFGDWVPQGRVRAEVDRYVGAATAAGRTPVVVLYAIPHRDCGGYSGGGLPGPVAYAAWVDQVVAGIAGRRVGVVLEPDALASMDCLSLGQRTERTAMLADATTRLTRSSATALYLDAGHSRWLPAAEAARRLSAAGVARARGFSLDVSNYQTTPEQIAYGERVSALLGGKHYVIDTSRNGRGPARPGPLSWCNPPGRALGVRPSVRTAGAHADAYLWVKGPGESDGACGRGEPAAGTWWDDYAVGLVTRALHDQSR